MKRLLVCLAALAFSASSYATGYSATGTVNNLEPVGSEVGSALTYAFITGFTTAGNCTVSGGFVVLRIKDDTAGNRQYAMLLVAKTNGTSVSVYVDDTDKQADNTCNLRNVYE